MRRRKLKWLWARLKQLSAMELEREALLMKLGGARAKVPAAWRLVDVEVAPHGASFSYVLNRSKLRQVRRREGRYLPRSNLCGHQPARLWQFYIQLVEIEAAFKNLKDDRPTASTSRSARSCARSPGASHPAPSSTSSPTSKCSTCTSPQQTAEP